MVAQLLASIHVVDFVKDLRVAIIELSYDWRVFRKDSRIPKPGFH